MDRRGYGYSELRQKGNSKYQIKKMIDSNKLIKLKRGLYSVFDELEDELFINQKDNKFLIYSNETALYLHNLVDRYPTCLSVTTKRGYHLRNKKLKVYYVDNEVLELGVITLDSMQGNTIRVYDLERTICDVIKNKNRIDQQTYIQGLQSYFLYGSPNLNKLLNYSRKMNIVKKVMTVVELYLKP